MKVSPARVSLASIALTAFFYSLPARARCRVSPGPEGEIATWLVLGPYPLARALRPAPTLRAVFDGILSTTPPRLGVTESSLQPLASTVRGALRWRPAASPHEWLDVGAAVGGRGPRVAYAGITVDASAAGERLLWLGSDDALAVYLDGREVFRRALPRASQDDQDVVRVALDRGHHALVVKLVARGDMDLFARITDARAAVDSTLSFELPGVDDTACNDLAARATVFEVDRRVVTEGTRVDAMVSFPGGVAHPEAESARAFELATHDFPEPLRTTYALNDACVTPVALHTVLPASDVRTLALRSGAASRTFTLRIPRSARAALLRANELLTPLDAAFMNGPFPVAPPPPRETPALPAAAIWSVERTAERLAKLIHDGDPDSAHIASEAGLLSDLLQSVARGRDPYAGRQGPLRRAYRSPLDGALQEYSIYVPPRYRGDRPFPMVVGLHGLHGSSHRMLPVLVGVYDEHEDRTHADRYFPTLPDLDAILVAPYGYGDAGYREQGEHDVMRVVEEVQRAYRIDPDRTYMTGLSMGGIGAAWVPLHHPDVFAAAAPLCGYHSYFVRNDTRGARRPWETFLMELRSNASYAENGALLPLYVVHGTLDRPTANSQSLIDRYTALGYPVEFEWPALGHNVWSTTYSGGRIVPYFLHHRRDPHPRRIRFRTPELRWRTSYWLSIDAMTGPEGRATTQRTGRWAEVDLDTDRRATGRAATRNVAALTLTPPASAYENTARALTLTVDGDRVELPFDHPTTLVRTDGHWQTGAAPPLRGGGPIREVFDTPLVVVYGASDASEARINARVAKHWASRGGVRASYPVVRDDAYTDAMGAGRTLVLIGRHNRVYERMAARLPVRFDGDAVVIGERRYAGDDVGAVFSAPNPDDPARTVLVVAGANPLGTARSRALPDLLPEYVVYDARVAPARGRVILGPAANVVAAGFFDSALAPVGEDGDPVATSITAGEGE